MHLRLHLGPEPGVQSFIRQPWRAPQSPARCRASAALQALGSSRIDFQAAVRFIITLSDPTYNCRETPARAVSAV